MKVTLVPLQRTDELRAEIGRETLKQPTVDNLKTSITNTHIMDSLVTNSGSRRSQKLGEN